MNKYQNRAIIEILAMIVLSASVGFGLAALSTIFTMSQILFGLGMCLMAYCFYTIYKIRVDQLKTLDEIQESRSK
jgi:fatty acid desaturase